MVSQYVHCFIVLKPINLAVSHVYSIHRKNNTSYKYPQHETKISIMRSSETAAINDIYLRFTVGFCRWRLSVLEAGPAYTALCMG